MIHLTSETPRVSASYTELKGGWAPLRAINSGGVLSIRMNNLAGMLIGIPVLGKGTETKCCWKTFHYFSSDAAAHLFSLPPSRVSQVTTQCPKKYECDTNAKNKSDKCSEW